MTTIHKITWKARFNKTNKDLKFEIVEKDCFVKSVSHPIVKWMVDNAWVHCYYFLNKKHAEIESIEHNYDEFPRTEINPHKFTDKEWMERIRYTKDG